MFYEKVVSGLQGAAHKQRDHLTKPKAPSVQRVAEGAGAMDQCGVENRHGHVAWI